MNIWAIQTVRKKRSKTVIKAKVVDLESSQIKWFNQNTLYEILSQGIDIGNLKIDNNKVVLDKYINDKKFLRYFNKTPYTDGLVKESYVLALKGYKGIYEFLADNPHHDNAYIHLNGTVNDLDRYLGRYNINWERNALYNGIITRDTWGGKKERNKIYIVKGGTIEELISENPSRELMIREQIPCNFCNLEYDNTGMIGVEYIKFNQESTFLGEGIEYFGRSLGGTLAVIMPKSLLKFSTASFKELKDILQITIKSELVEIPDEFAMDTPLQVFEYPPECELISIGDRAFYECNDLRTALISKVAKIGDAAFYNTSVPKVVVPRCKYIGRYAFAGNSKLKVVKIESPCYIHEYAFEDCNNLERIDLESAVVIGPNAFKGCKKLKEVTVNSKAKIAKNAFDKNTIVHIKQ